VQQPGGQQGGHGREDGQPEGAGIAQGALLGRGEHRHLEQAPGDQHPDDRHQRGHQCRGHTAGPQPAGVHGMARPGAAAIAVGVGRDGHNRLLSSLHRPGAGLPIVEIILRHG
jgi:hypothetical protein